MSFWSSHPSGGGKSTDNAAGTAASPRAAAILHPAENRSGLLSFRYLVPFAALVCLIFGLVALRDRRAGGYRAQVERARFQQGIRV